MRLISTAGAAPPADLPTALRAGLAPDGGLYLPECLEPLPDAARAALRGGAFPDTALTVARHVLGGEPPAAALGGIVRAALDFPIPLVPLGERLYALELFHGPTCAFKDVGARFLARLLAHYHGDAEPPLTILVATSGDTGGAVAQAFFDVVGTRVVVLYPEGKVSSLQERQFTTLGGNVTALAVAGTFDDCQNLAKEALAQPDRRGLGLTSANSINIGRLLPQIFYYFHAWAQLPAPPAELIISVPSGNFGNLTAGLLGKRLGLPVTRFVAATNVNDVVPEYLAGGAFHPRPSVATISNAMDVGNPSNFARILALYADSRERLRADVGGSRHTDDATREAIREVHRAYGYVLDPHGAVAYLGLVRALRERPGATGIFLATAHPAKFGDVVEPLIGRPIPLPERLAACVRREPRVTRIRAEIGALREVLRRPVAPRPGIGY
jgi:threonine synthase